MYITVVPLAFMLAAYFLYRRHYKLDEAEYDRICTQLGTRKG